MEMIFYPKIQKTDEKKIMGKRSGSFCKSKFCNFLNQFWLFFTV